MSGEKGSVLHVLNGGGQGFYLWRTCAAGPEPRRRPRQDRNCESFTLLSNQHVFRVQESVYGDGKQNR